MKKYNYKAGDKVRIIGNKGLGGARIQHLFADGEIVTVEKVDGTTLRCTNGVSQWVDVESVEPVEDKETDKPAIFNRDDIKAGYLLEVKDGRDGSTFYMTVLPSIRDPLGCCCPDAHWWPLSFFSKDKLIYTGCVFTATIMRVYGLTYNGGLLDNTPENRDLLWMRQEEPKVVEMTVAEISEKLGYEVKIVKEKNN